MKEINNLRLNKYFTLPPLKLQSINLKQCCDITELKQYSCLCKFLKYTKKNWSRLKMHLRKDELFRTSVQVSNLYTHIHIYIYLMKEAPTKRINEISTRVLDSWGRNSEKYYAFPSIEMYFFTIASKWTEMQREIRIKYENGVDDEGRNGKMKYLLAGDVWSTTYLFFLKDRSCTRSSFFRGIDIPLLQLYIYLYYIIMRLIFRINL